MSGKRVYSNMSLSIAAYMIVFTMRSYPTCKQQSRSSILVKESKRHALPGGTKQCMPPFLIYIRSFLTSTPKFRLWGHCQLRLPHLWDHSRGWLQKIFSFCTRTPTIGRIMPCGWRSIFIAHSCLDLCISGNDLSHVSKRASYAHAWCWSQFAQLYTVGSTVWWAQPFDRPNQWSGLGR